MWNSCRLLLALNPSSSRVSLMTSLHQMRWQHILARQRLQSENNTVAWWHRYFKSWSRSGSSHRPSLRTAIFGTSHRAFAAMSEEGANISGERCFAMPCCQKVSAETPASKRARLMLGCGRLRRHASTATAALKLSERHISPLIWHPAVNGGQMWLRVHNFVRVLHRKSPLF